VQNRVGGRTTFAAAIRLANTDRGTEAVILVATNIALRHRASIVA
jgi:hypothetical protein